MLDTRPNGWLCCVSYNRMESSEATANTIRYGNWNILGRVSTEPSAEERRQ